MPTISANRFLRAVQARGARVSVTASATRKQGGGIVEPARAFLAVMPLSAFSTADPVVFTQRLNAATDELMATFPSESSSWGLARKLLNIFLRDCLYTSYLEAEHKLSAAEQLMEVPLDSISAAGLIEEASKGGLPRWPGVKHNTPQVSERYQDFAAQFAAKQGIARVHLDTYWWGERAAPSEA